jgi:CRP-like cAMP-binding protein
LADATGGRKQGIGRQNLPLATLDPASLDLLVPRLSSTWIDREKVLATPSRPLRTLYFPETAVMSMAGRVGRRRVPVISIGNEGIVGYWLGTPAGDQLAVDVVCVVPGRALRLPVRYLREAMATRVEVRTLIAEVTQSATVQLVQNVMCAKVHTLPARCARRLLELAHTLGPIFELTHEELAAVLGATRPSTTRVMNSLAASRIVESARGTIGILDLAALEARSCACYRTLVARRERLGQVDRALQAQPRAPAAAPRLNSPGRPL